MADCFVSSVLYQWESNDRSRLVLAVNDVLLTPRPPCRAECVGVRRVTLK